jgi:hypothetical protein
MKNKCLTLILALLAIQVLAGQDNSQNVLGIVLSVKGELYHVHAGETRNLMPADQIYMDSVLQLKPGAKAAKVQIGTRDGLVVYKRFPVSFKALDLAVALSADQRNNYLAGIGGLVMKGPVPIEKSETAGEPVMEWQFAQLVVDKDLLEQSFTLILSKSEGSFENLSLNPLYFKLSPGFGGVKTITYNLIDYKTRSVLKTGAFSSGSAGFSLPFKGLGLKSSAYYQMKTHLTGEGISVDWDLYINVLGDEVKKKVADMAEPSLKKTDNELERKLILAGKYRIFSFELKALGLLKEAGIELDGLF